ncbi:vWA domain-containing protein [Sorangium sp. So ce131]|uniref:vWA domain-containing protein n=1 Tax=Sorangium sp. So ce131 TaxID=3133282 RepID=UPI003F631599
MAGPSTKWMGALSRSGSAEVWAPRALLLLTLLTASAVIAGACSGDDSDLEGPQGGTVDGPDGGPGTGDPCADGEEVECHVTVGEHEGVLTCLDGIRRCEGGRYGACEGSMSMRRSPLGAAPSGSGEGAYPRPLANSQASDGGLCATNPCDPTCQSFEETPDGGPIALEGTGTTYSWEVGDINEIPENVARQGTHQPCTTSEDCQFDQYCENPASGACAHDVCATGASLLSSCSGCVSKVCAADPTCCTKTDVPGDCAHDACVAVNAEAIGMNTTCGDPCIAAICAADPRCCTPYCTSNLDCQTRVAPTSTCNAARRCVLPSATSCPPGTRTQSGGSCTGVWSANCVALVATHCPGKTCAEPPRSWSASCVNLAETMCGADCTNNTPTCAHDKCTTGPRLSAACDPCVAQVCAQPGAASCCLSEWTEQCVDLVESVCGESCPQQGVCKSYLPNETNPECAGVDLTIGVPCGGTVPVCNRGNTQAPAGIRIQRYAAGAGQLPSSAPGRINNACNPTGGTLACTTAEPIDPGECINVAGCTGLADGMELFVNPPGAAQVAECRCGNNGSIYQSGACESPGCIATASVSLVRPVTLFVALDKSDSMRRTAGSPTNDRLTDRWLPAANALKSFFSDPESAGLGVALRFWPYDNPGPCNDNPSCQPPGGGGCALPIVPFDGTAARRLTADPRPTDQQELALINAIDNITNELPSGDTPMYPALDGAATWAINYKNAHPEEEVGVVLVTDGLPSHCNTGTNSIANLAANAFRNHGVRVHAVGFGEASATVINAIADRGGGQAYNLGVGTALQQGLGAALVSIRGDALPCDVTVPLAGVADPASVSVVYESSAGAQTPLTRVASAGACGNGWYFADATNTSVKLCPQTCETARENPGGRIRAIVPCVSTELDPMETTWERYHGVCPPGSKAQWGFLRYRTVTPGDSSVEFYVRSADDPADLGAATVRLAATAHAVPTDTQVCDETSTPMCAVDLFDVLGELPDAQREYLDVRMTLNPTSTGGGGVQVQDWEITYSCPDTE